jgi:hypothetical protein
MQKTNRSLRQAIFLFYQIASAVDFMNKQGYFHCDIKPDNILMFGEKPVLADFGLSFPNRDEQRQIMACGTANYGAPQSKENEVTPAFAALDPSLQHHYQTQYDAYMNELTHEPVDFVKHDIYSLGCIFFELLTNNQLLHYGSGNLAKMYFDKDDRLQQTFDHVWKQLNARMNAKIGETDKTILAKLDVGINNDKLSIEALKLIKRMCSTSQRDRIASVTEVLQHPIFANRALSQPIPGRVIVPSMKKGACIIDNPAQWKTIVEFVCELVSKLFNTFTEEPFTLMFETLNLFYRCSQLVQLQPNKGGDAYHLLICCLSLVYRANFIVSLGDEEVLALIESATNKQIATQQMFIQERENMMTRMNHIVGYVEGMIRSMTLTSKTDNAVECLWYLCQCMNNCKMIAQDPASVHYHYSSLEMANNWMERRVPLSNVLRFSFNDNINKLSIISSYDTPTHHGELSTAFVDSESAKCKLSQVFIDPITGDVTRLEQLVMPSIQEEDEYDGDELDISLIDDLYEDAEIDN